MPVAAQLVFASPLGALVGLAGLVALAAHAQGRRRARAAARALGLPVPTGSRPWTPLVLALTAALLAFASAQPVLRTRHVRFVRAGTQAYFVVDTSRSMLASAGPGTRTRITRAIEAARRIRDSLGDVPSGLASLTDRLLPHLFPTSDPEAFGATLERSIEVDQPPPEDQNVVATTYQPLTALLAGNYFDHGVKNRLVIVLTDGQSRPFPVAGLRRAFRARAGIKAVFVRIGNVNEGIYDGRRLEQGYRPDPQAPETMRRLADAVGGRVFGEHSLTRAAAAARALLGPGRSAKRGFEPAGTALAPFAAAAAAALALLLALREIFSSDFGRDAVRSRRKRLRRGSRRPWSQAIDSREVR